MWLWNRNKKALQEKQELPLGMQAFEDWSDRIISGSLLPADNISQKFALASMLMHLGPTVDHEADLYFIKSLRKAAINQVAHAKLTEIKEADIAKRKAETEAQAVAEKAAQTPSEVTPTTTGVTDAKAEVLAN